MRRNVFDFDNTIYRGDSSVDFYLYCMARCPRMLPEPLALGYHAVRHYVFHSLTTTQFKRRMYRFLTFLPDVDALVEAFWPTHLDRIKPWYRELRHSDDLIISASPEFLLRPVCKTLGVELIASRVDRHTGEYDGLNCHDEEKVRRLNERYPDCEIAAFYSDSLSDTPLAKLAEHAYRVRGERITDFFE